MICWKWKKTIGAVSAAFVFFFLLGFSHAGDYHRSSTLQCGDCHIMHGSQQNAYSGAEYRVSPAGVESYPFTVTPSDYLLRGTSVSALCATCHNGYGSTGNEPPDVIGSAAYENTNLRRAGGAFYASDGVSDIVFGTATTRAHNMGRSVGPTNGYAPGSNPSWPVSDREFKCTTCHDAHGNANYRNLVLRPGNAALDINVTVGEAGGDAVSQLISTPTKDQYTQFTGGIQGAANNVAYKSDKLSRWCQGCHTRMHAAADPPTWPDANIGGSGTGDSPTVSTDQWLRHPVVSATMANGVTNKHIDPSFYFYAAQSHVPVISATKTIPGTPAGSDNIPSCMSCHKAHGSPKPFLLIYDDATTSAKEDAAATLMNLCQECHNE